MKKTTESWGIKDIFLQNLQTTFSLFKDDRSRENLRGASMAGK